MRVANRISSQSASIPQKAVGPSVRGFMFCIAVITRSPFVHENRQSLAFAPVVKALLEEADRLAHCRLDVQRFDILPVFLE